MYDLARVPVIEMPSIYYIRIKCRETTPMKMGAGLCKCFAHGNRKMRLDGTIRFQRHTNPRWPRILLHVIRECCSSNLLAPRIPDGLDNETSLSHDDGTKWKDIGGDVGHFCDYIFRLCRTTTPCANIFLTKTAEHLTTSS